MSKYYNCKTIMNGIVFDSKKEANRYAELLIMEKAGLIKDIERQKKFVLIPAQREPCDEVYLKGLHKGEHKKGKLLEKECSYIADFVYKDENGKYIVEDCKGVRTEVYKIKKKLMLYVYGISIKET